MTSQEIEAKAEKLRRGAHQRANWLFKANGESTVEIEVGLLIDEIIGCAALMISAAQLRVVEELRSKPGNHLPKEGE